MPSQEFAQWHVPLDDVLESTPHQSAQETPRNPPGFGRWQDTFLAIYAYLCIIRCRSTMVHPLYCSKYGFKLAWHIGSFISSFITDRASRKLQALAWQTLYLARPGLPNSLPLSGWITNLLYMNIRVQEKSGRINYPGNSLSVGFCHVRLVSLATSFGFTRPWSHTKASTGRWEWNVTFFSAC